MYGTSRVNNCKKCLNNLVAISSQRVSVTNIYCSMDAAIILCIWLVTAVTVTNTVGTLGKLQCFWFSRVTNGAVWMILFTHLVASIILLQQLAVTLNPTFHYFCINNLPFVIWNKHAANDVKNFKDISFVLNADIVANKPMHLCSHSRNPAWTHVDWTDISGRTSQCIGTQH